jgi:SAM-dependent methyltransferase
MEAVDLLRIAERRLRPPLSDPSFLVLRSRTKIFERWFSQLGTPAMVLDIGGRYQPYRSLLGSGVRNYIALDLQPTPFVDVVADGQRLPFASGTFDLVIATQVFEYFAKPHQGAEEVLRVLKPGGTFLMSVAAFAPRFGDEDYWRFTPRGLRSILGGFQELELVPELSGASSLLRALNVALGFLASKHRVTRKLYEVSVCPALNLLGLAIEHAKLTNDQFAANFSVRAIRPSNRDTSKLNERDCVTDAPAFPQEGALSLTAGAARAQDTRMPTSP